MLRFWCLSNSRDHLAEPKNRSMVCRLLYRFGEAMQQHRLTAFYAKRGDKSQRFCRYDIRRPA